MLRLLFKVLPALSVPKAARLSRPAPSSEFAGVAGAGKTQLCLHLCCSVQLPSSLGGSSGQAVYLDTEGSFCADRLTQIAVATKDCGVAALKAMGRLRYCEMVSYCVSTVASAARTKGPK